MDLGRNVGALSRDVSLAITSKTPPPHTHTPLTTPLTGLLRRVMVESTWYLMLK